MIIVWSPENGTWPSAADRQRVWTELRKERDAVVSVCGYGPRTATQWVCRLYGTERAGWRRKDGVNGRQVRSGSLRVHLLPATAPPAAGKKGSTQWLHSSLCYQSASWHFLHSFFIRLLICLMANWRWRRVTRPTEKSHFDCFCWQAWKCTRPVPVNLVNWREHCQCSLDSQWRTGTGSQSDHSANGWPVSWQHSFPSFQLSSPLWTMLSGPVRVPCPLIREGKHTPSVVKTWHFSSFISAREWY